MKPSLHQRLGGAELIPIPLAAAAGVALVDGMDIVWAVPVGLAAGLLALLVSDRDLEVGLLAGALAMLFVAGPWAALASILLVGLLLASRQLRLGVPLVGIAVTAFFPGDVGAWAWAGAAALLASWRMPAPGMVRGSGPLHLGLGLAMAGAGAFFLAPAWAAGAGFLAGLVGRALAAHPANEGAARLARTVGAVGAPLPAFAVVVLASLGRFSLPQEVPLLLVAWGTIAFGVSVLGFGYGAGALLRSTEVAKSTLLGGSAGATVAVMLAAVTEGLQEATAAAGLLWPLAVGPTAIGTAAWGRGVGVSDGHRVVGALFLVVGLVLLRLLR